MRSGKGPTGTAGTAPLTVLTSVSYGTELKYDGKEKQSYPYQNVYFPVWCKYGACRIETA